MAFFSAADVRSWEDMADDRDVADADDRLFREEDEDAPGSNEVACGLSVLSRDAPFFFSSLSRRSFSFLAFRRASNSSCVGCGLDESSLCRDPEVPWETGVPNGRLERGGASSAMSEDDAANGWDPPNGFVPDIGGFVGVEEKPIEFLLFALFEPIPELIKFEECPKDIGGAPVVAGANGLLAAAGCCTAGGDMPKCCCG